MPASAWLIPSLFLTLCCRISAAETDKGDVFPLDLPRTGDSVLRCIAPQLLELTFITSKQPDPAPVREWDFVGVDGRLHLPAASNIVVTMDGTNDPVITIGFRRRVVYAPLKERDLRIGNYLYLKLATPIRENQSVEVKDREMKLWTAKTKFAVKFDPQRWSPAIHVNQVGYLPDAPKTAMVGYFLGSLGELDLNQLSITNPVTFALLEAQTGRRVYEGRLSLRTDHGFPLPAYQRVMQADFSEFKQPGEYRLLVPGLGVSFPFFINEGVAAAFARTYALGLYHQRCGTDNAMPFTRFTHGPCHTAPAEVPVPEASYKFTWETIAEKSSDFKNNPRHTAPQLKSEKSQLYPFVNPGKVDVSGGHHDAGDYSKYTINSATLIHHLVFAVDAFPGAAELDNLGLPESQDGKSDLLQEAKWEADFLARMQDADGGFYFLVYPREREYEIDVLPDRGDPQVVWPKTTAVTAAAVAALAQCASSPRFKQEFPEAAALYLKKARSGWAFLQRAIQAHGRDGAYQKVTHYGDEFMHDDELTWAACEMFLATGETDFHKQLIGLLNPSGDTRKWGWWRLYESYGCAIRSYAFAARSGRVKQNLLDQALLAACENEIIADAMDQLRRSDQSAYATSFPEETKRTLTAGWYFSGDAAFSLAVASQLDYPIMNDPRPKFLRAILGNLNYEAGCNPVNVCYITGLGWIRPREIVHQYAQNDRRMLPPSGIPIGNLQGGFSWLDKYQKELGALSFPLDGDERTPYPIYDRWGESFNLSTEFVIANQARGLAYLSWLMARTSLKKQPWKSATAHIVKLSGEKETKGLLTAGVESPGLDLRQARIVWEAQGHEPAIGSTFSFPMNKAGKQWVEVEAQLPDGRRVFGSSAANAIESSAVVRK
ncbi:MAG: hypothetical protein JWR26_1946 [Pedosphaera sp.]|nr:hypothetical protein [Pedosphaera sp.]